MPVLKAEPLLILDPLHSTPARRYLPAERVPDDAVWAMLDAAVRGPSGCNRQRWGWVVVTDPAIKQQVAGWYREGWSKAYGHRREPILAAASRICRAEPTVVSGGPSAWRSIARRHRCGSSRCCAMGPVPAIPGWVPRSTGRCSS